MGSIRTRARRLGSLFAFYSPTFPEHGESATNRNTVGSSRVGALNGVRWQLILAAGVVVGVIPQLLLYPVTYGYILASALLTQSVEPEQARQFGLVMGLWGLPLVHMLLAAFAASWVSRRAGETPVAHGVLVALVSVVVGQAVGLIYGDLSMDGVVKYLALGLAGGLVGGIEGRTALAGQETLYEASRGIGVASGPQAVADAIGDNPLSPAAVGVALWWSGHATDGEEAVSFGAPRAPEVRTSRGWPGSACLDRVDVWELVGSGRGSSRTLRAGELPAQERVAWRDLGIKSVLLLPLVASGGERIGLLAVASRERRFPRSTVRSYQTVAAQAALALENLRLVEEARRAGRQAGVLRERQRMAHEIHDTLAQGFTSIVMNLEAAEGIMPPGSGQMHHHLDQARLTARESLTEARRLVWALRPERLEEASLPEALAGLAERWSSESGIAASVATTGARQPLTPVIEATLFRVAQEALANVRKHARGASRVALTLSYMGDAVALDARDDGVGFDPSQEDKRVRDHDSGGFGLKGMRERVEEAGGTLSVESAIGEGTTLAVELPVVAGAPEAEGSREVREVP